MSTTAAERAQILQTIANVKAALSRHADASESSENEVAYGTNRGQKLKRKARQVNEGHLYQPAGPKIHLEEVEYANRKRRVLFRKRKRHDEQPMDHSDNDFDPEDDDPYYNVQIEKLLAPAAAPIDIPNHPALSVIYKSQTLNQLSQQALDIICAEHKHLVVIKQLLAQFLGDDPFIPLEKMEDIREPAFIRAAREEIEAQERKEREEKERQEQELREQEEAKLRELENATTNGENVNGNGTLVNLKLEDDSPTDRGSQTPQPLHRMTTRSAANPPTQQQTAANSATNTRPTSPSIISLTPQEILDNTSPWFYPPVHNPPDRDLGLNPIEADETRQLLLHAVQKEEEFIRGLVKVREGLLKAERLRKNVWEWCRADGVDELSDGEDWVDEERWGLEPGELKKGVEEEEEEDARKKTTRGRK